MPKKKKEGIALRTTKATFRGLGKLLVRSYNLSRNITKNQIKKQKLRKNAVYQSFPKFQEFQIEKEIQGSFEETSNKLYNSSVIALIFGKRGSGKSALGFKILENIHSTTKRPCHVLGVEQEKVPKWISPIISMEQAEENSVVLVDESALSYSSRSSQSKANKELTNIMAIARHKNLTLLFVTQNTGLVDVNVLKLSDMLLIKEGSLLQLEMERPEIKKFYEKSSKIFKNLKGQKQKYTYIIDSDFEGAISHPLPSFWSDNLSKSHS